jgi:uroporphyrinogen decarboxylase
MIHENARTTVIKALSHKQTNRVPYEILLADGCAKKVADAVGQDYIDNIGNFADCEYFRAFRRWISKDEQVDDFGTTFLWQNYEQDICDIKSGIMKNDDMSTYKIPLFDIQKQKDAFKAFDASSRDNFCYVSLNFAIFERAWLLRGMEELLCDMLLNEKFVHELFESLCDYFYNLIDLSAQYGFDGIQIGDDWGMQNGMIMGAELWRKMIRPHYAALVERIKSKGMYIIHHSCGDISDILGDMIDLGVDAYQTVQPEIYDLSSIKKKYGKNLCFWGGISTQSTMPYATAEEVRECVKRTISTLFEDGGFVCGPTHTICNDVPVENILALVETLKEFNY